MDWFREEKRMTGLDTQSSVQPWIQSDKTRKKNTTVLITLFFNNNTLKRIGNAIKMQHTGQNCQERRIKDCDSGRQNSFAIITCTTVPGDYIDRVTSQNGDRVIFERLATPRPAPKVTLKSFWWSFAASVPWVAEPKLGRTLRRRTSSATLLIQLVTELIMVEFIFMDFELAKMAPAQLAGRLMVRRLSETTSNSRFQRSRKSNQATGAIRLRNDKLKVVTN